MKVEIISFTTKASDCVVVEDVEEIDVEEIS